MLLAYMMAALSPIFYAASTVVDSHLANKLFPGRITTLLFYGGIASLFALPFFFMFGPIAIPPLSILPFIIFSAFITAAYLLPYFAALRHLDTSIIVALFSLGKIIIPFLAFFMVGELLNIMQYVGFVMIVGASVALSRADSPKGGVKINPAFWLMLSTSILLAVTSVFDKYSLERIDWISFAFWTTLLSSAFAATLFLHGPTRRDIVKSAGMFRKGFWTIIMTDAFSFAGMMAATFAISKLPVTVDTAIHSIQPFWTLLFGVALAKTFKKNFQESHDARAVIRKLIGFSVIFIGIMMTALF